MNCSHDAQSSFTEGSSFHRRGSDPPFCPPCNVKFHPSCQQLRVMRVYPTSLRLISGTHSYFPGMI